MLLCSFTKQIGPIVNWLRSALALCVIAALQLVGATSANATSDFDNFPVSDNWMIQSNSCPPVDMRYTWGGLIDDQVPAAYAQMVANGSNGGWYVSRFVNTENHVRGLVVMIVKSENARSTYTINHHYGGGGWLGNSGNEWLYTTTEGTRASSTFDLRIMLNSSCEPVVENYGYAASGYSEYSPYQTPEYMGMPDMTGRPFNFRLYMLLAVGDFVAPSGYAGPDIPDEVSAPFYHYVAMGDSFSSGEGNGPYEAGSDSTTNKCHRSPITYPRMLQSILDLGPMAFVACSGATTEDLINGTAAEGGWGEDPQVDALSSNTENVTITIGGNDLGFADVLKQCAEAAYGTIIGWGCSSDTNLNDDIDDRMAALDDQSGTSVLNPEGKEVQSILSVLTAISSAAPNARIFIGGYPQLFGDNTGDFTANGSAPGGAVCSADTIGVTYSYDDAQWMNDRADELNGVISDAVDQAVINGIDATFVPAALFGGHGLCDSSDAWIYGILLDSNFIPTPASIHPDFSGQSIAYELAFETLMD